MTDFMEKVAQVAPEQYEFLTKTAEELRDGPFFEDTLNEMNGIIKIANAGGFGGKLLRGLGQAGIGLGSTIAAGVVYSMANDLVDAAKRGLTKNRDYKSMLANNPDLKQQPAKEVQKYFNVIHRFNPEYASEPTVAGQLVRNMLESATFDTRSIGELVSGHKNLGDTKKLPFPGKTPWESGRDIQRKDLDIQRLTEELSNPNKGKKEQAELQRMSNDAELHPLRKQQLEQQLGANGIRGELDNMELIDKKRKLFGPEALEDANAEMALSGIPMTARSRKAAREYIAGGGRKK